jgi:SWI/SNF-related matrix-associated actin-dependent regulator of chromatin subfamily A-like protein 1
MLNLFEKGCVCGWIPFPFNLFFNWSIKKKVKEMAGRIKLKLYPFQKEDIAFILSRNGRALVANEMGTGKTIIALGWLRIAEAFPALIIVPACGKQNWLKESRKWSKPGTTTYICYGRKPSSSDIKEMKKSQIVIINYEILDSWKDYLDHIITVIPDEAHKVKNTKTLQSKAFSTLARKAKHIVALTGTPVESRPIDIYNITKHIAPAVLPDWISFVTHFCGGSKRTIMAHGRRISTWDTNGATNTEWLHKLLTETIMTRRKKEDVLKELPPKQFMIESMEMTDWRTYQLAQEGFKTWANQETKNNMEGLAKIELLKQAAWEGKKSQVFDWLDNALNDGKKTVIFAIHKKVVSELSEYLNKKKIKHVKLDGSTPAGKRQEVVDTFQNDSNCQVFIGNIEAAGVLITLTASSRVVFLELPWTPAKIDQATDRCHRIGQKSASVDIYFLLANNTVEDYLFEIIGRKRRVVDAIVDNRSMAKMSVYEELVAKLLK